MQNAIAAFKTIGQKIKSYLNLFSKAATTFIFCFHQNQKNVCLASFKAHLPYVILHKVKKRAKIGCRLSPHKWSIVIPHIYHNEKETLYYHVDHITFFWSSLNEFIFLFPFFNGDITQSPSRESADCVLLLQKSSNWAHDKDIYQFTPKPIEIKAS